MSHNIGSKLGLSLDHGPIPNRGYHGAPISSLSAVTVFSRYLYDVVLKFMICIAVIYLHMCEWGTLAMVLFCHLNIIDIQHTTTG